MAKQKAKPEFWGVMRVKNEETGAYRQLADDGDKLSKDEARKIALGAFLHGTTEKVYIENLTTDERIDLTAEMLKVEEEYTRRRKTLGGFSAAPTTHAELEDMIRAVLPEGA